MICDELNDDLPSQTPTIRIYLLLIFKMVETLKLKSTRINEMPIAASRIFVASSKLAVAIVAGAALLAFASNANAVTFSTSGAGTMYGLGDTLHTQFDVLQVDSGAGSLVANTTIQLNKLTFIAGVNALVPASYHHAFSETVTVAGAASQTLNVPFDLHIDYSDTLTIPGGQRLSFLVGDSLWTLVLNGLTIGPNPGISQIGHLTAQVTETAATPLPAAILLFGSGLGAMGLFSRRRRIRASAAGAV